MHMVIGKRSPIIMKKSNDADIHSRDFDEFRRFINAQRQRFWHVHFAKKTQHPRATVNYYFGFLANRVVGNKLSKVREALGMESYPPRTPALRYGQMIKSFLKVDPFECILCSGRMIFTAFHAGAGRKNIINEALSRRGEGIE